MTPLVTYQSSQVAVATSASSLAITKPTSLAAGDLLIAHIFYSDAGTRDLNTPTGWTLRNETPTGPGTYSSAILSKVADADDAAATNFTFTVTASVSTFYGALTRITGFYATTPIDQIHATAGTTDSGITPTLGNGLFLMFVSAADMDGAFATVSNYAVATSNPTWTEAYDGGENNGGVGHTLAMAYAGRSPITATGNASVTLSDTADAVVHIMNLPVAPISLFSATFGVAVPTLPITTGSPYSATFGFPEPTVTGSTPMWTNETKHTTSWTNQAQS